MNTNNSNNGNGNTGNTNPEPDKIVIPTTTPNDREQLNEGIRNPKPSTTSNS